jgi:hypothetical protein
MSADALARKSITTYSDVADTFISKQPALKEIPPTISIGLQKNMKEHRSIQKTPTQPSHLPNGLVPIQLP